MEVFTFLAMGGVRERITIIPLMSMASTTSALATPEEALHATLIRFRAQEAQCFRAEERERLLAVIEASFGDFHTFNVSVRGLFRTNVHRSYAMLPLDEDTPRFGAVAPPGLTPEPFAPPLAGVEMGTVTPSGVAL